MTRSARSLPVLLAVACSLLVPRVVAAEHGAAGGDGGSATLIVILLLGSLTAGLFFASPLRRRLERPSSRDGSGGSQGDEQPSGALRPVAEVVGRGKHAVDSALDAVGDKVAARGRRLGTPRPSPPLPPMPGGDVFFADWPPEPSEPLATPDSNEPPGRRAAQPPQAWSTGPVSRERYRRRR